MSTLFPILQEISKTLGKPYFSVPEMRFGFRKGNCIIIISYSSGLRIDSFVGGASLCLDSKAFFDFASSIRKLKSTHRVASATHLEFNPSSDEFGKDLFNVFPQLSYNLQPELLKGKKVTPVAEFIEGTLKVLVEIEKLVRKYRARDVGFNNLKKLWKNTISVKNKNEKGKLLEKLLSTLIARDENFTVTDVHLRTRSEELDIVVENNAMIPFFSQLKCPIILFECKNWSSKIGAGEIRNFAQKVQNRPRALCNIGILVTVTDLTRDARDELLGQRGKDFTIAVLERKDLETTLTQRVTIAETLKTIIRRSGFR